MNLFKHKYKLMMGVYVAMVVSFLVDWGTFDSEIQKAIYLIAPAITLMVGVRVLHQLGWDGKRSIVVKWMMAGMVLWFFGEVGILVMDIYNLDLYPTIVDALFILGYPMFMMAVLVEWRVFGLSIKELDKTLLAILVGIGVLVSIIVLYLGFIVGHDSEASLFVNAVTVSWSLGDLVVGAAGMLMLAMVWEFRQGRIRHAWLAFMAWGVLNLVADTLYGMFPEALYDGSFLAIVLDSVWIAGYFMMTYYLLEIGDEIANVKARLTRVKQK